MKNNRLRIAFAATVLALFITRVSLAHAFLDRAEPKVGSTVHQSPAQVRIWFTQDVEPAFSRIKVYDMDGKQVDGKDTHVGDSEKNLLIVSLPQLSAGTYKVSWHVVSVDTHPTQGDFKFTISP